MSGMRFGYVDINHASRNDPKDEQRGFSVALKNGERLHIPANQPEAGLVREWLKARVEA